MFLLSSIGGIFMDYEIPSVKELTRIQNSHAIGMNFDDMVKVFEKYVFDYIEKEVKHEPAYKLNSIELDNLGQIMERTVVNCGLPMEFKSLMFPDVLYAFYDDLEAKGYKVLDFTFNEAIMRANVTISWNRNITIDNVAPKPMAVLTNRVKDYVLGNVKLRRG